MNRIGMKEPERNYKKCIEPDSLKEKMPVGGENDEVQEHTDGNDAGSTKTDTSAS